MRAKILDALDEPAVGSRQAVLVIYPVPARHFRSIFELRRPLEQLCNLCWLDEAARHDETVALHLRALLGRRQLTDHGHFQTWRVRSAEVTKSTVAWRFFGL